MHKNDGLNINHTPKLDIILDSFPISTFFLKWKKREWYDINHPMSNVWMGKQMSTFKYMYTCLCIIIWTNHMPLSFIVMKICFKYIEYGGRSQTFATTTTTYTFVSLNTAILEHLVPSLWSSIINGVSTANLKSLVWLDLESNPEPPRLGANALQLGYRAYFAGNHRYVDIIIELCSNVQKLVPSLSNCACQSHTLYSIWVQGENQSNIYRNNVNLSYKYFILTKDYKYYDIFIWPCGHVLCSFNWSVI